MNDNMQYTIIINREYLIYNPISIDGNLSNGYINPYYWVDDYPLALSQCPGCNRHHEDIIYIYIFFGSGFPTKTFATIAGMGDNPRYENKHVEH